MKIQEVVDIARYSELNSVAMKDDVNAIVAFLNIGMTELYTRFPIKVKEFVAELVEGQSLYDLPDDYMYALSAYVEPEETAATNELVQIAINDAGEEKSIYLPDWKTLQVPDEITSSIVSLVYVAKPTPIRADNLEAEIELPDTLVDALMSYLGYRAHLGIRSDAQSENNAQWQRFERNCKKARDLGVAYQLDALDMSKRLSDRGFV